MNVAVHPSVSSERVEDGLSLAAVTVVPVDDLTPESEAISDADALVVELGEHPMRRIRELTRVAEAIGLPILVVAESDQLALIESAPGITDLIVQPVNPVEMRLRLRRLQTDRDLEDIVVFKDLELNPLTYQATLAGVPLDLTFMEYELLRFLVGNPTRVWSRAQLLSKVWGYDYYGGARTVDVHVRRLRAKLGEERASWISTVRSVGYRFG